jgi:hypothetical protein
MKRTVACIGVLLGSFALAEAQQITGSKTAGRGPLTPQVRPAKVMGIWSGSAVDPLGETYEFDMTLAQTGSEIYGFATVTIDPNNALFGRPSVRLRGRAEGATLTLGMSGILNNLCNDSSTVAYDVRVLYDADSETLVTESVSANQPIGCGLLFEDFIAMRRDAPHRVGNTDILGTWDGRVDGVYGWFFAPPLMTPPRKSFFLEEHVLMGFMETREDGPWAEMNLVWDPVTQRCEYVYECVTLYTLAGTVDGNKFSGVNKYTGASDEDFFGVFVHTLRPFYVEPGPQFAPFCP